MPPSPWQIVQIKMHQEDLRRLNLLAVKDKTSAEHQFRFAVQEYIAQRKLDLEQPKKANSKKVLNFRPKK
jgi:hypothetical protein